MAGVGMAGDQDLKITPDEAEHLCVLRSLEDTDRKAVVEAARDLCVFGNSRAYHATEQDAASDKGPAVSGPC